MSSGEAKEGTARVSVEGHVTARGVARLVFDGIRLAVFGILLSIGVTVGVSFGIAYSWWIGLLAGAGSSVLLILLLKWRRASNALIRLMVWVMPLPKDRAEQ